MVTAEGTFSKQAGLPPLPVPTIEETAERYLRSACVLLSPAELEKTKKAVEEFRTSNHVALVQKALLEKAKGSRNWIEDWWYDAYVEMRVPLVPYTNIASINPCSAAHPDRNVQILRAADAAHHMMRFWERIRREQVPITKSRGAVWDMYQYHVLFNSNRTPALPKDRMDRYFKTEAEGSCPTHLAVICRGNVWKLEMMVDGELRSPDDLVRVLGHIQRESAYVALSPITLTTWDRDSWARAREALITTSAANRASIQTIEESVFVLALSDDVVSEETELIRHSIMGRSDYAWSDKCMNVIVMGDSQITTQADHSNLDAIVILDAGNQMGEFVRKEIWTPQPTTSTDLPELLQFDLTPELVDAIEKAEMDFKKLSNSIRARVIRFRDYGNDRLRKAKLYSDTIVQLALQIAFARVHGSFGPIYETASTRKFFHGRTETVRGLTHEMKAFGDAVLRNRPISEQLPLFKAAYDAHNKLMAEATEAMGIDRHLYGLRKTLAALNSGGKCQPKLPEPAIFKDAAWAKSGGDGNFLLSTSFLGYRENAAYGMVCAMRDDGYGTFYSTHPTNIQITATDYVGTKSDLDAYGREIVWALRHLGDIISQFENGAKL